VDAFAQKQKKEVNDLFWARAKLIAKVVWSVAKFVKSGTEAFAKVTALATPAGVFLSVPALKAILATGNDFWSAAQEFVGAVASERSLYAKLDQAAKELKKFKKPDPVPLSAVQEIEKQFGPYNTKLLGADEGAKKLAIKLDAMLTALEKGKFRDAAAQKAAEDQVDLTIRSIRKTSKNIIEGRKLMQSARSKVQEAAKRAQADPKSWWDYAATIWKFFDAGVDMRDDSIGAENWESVFKKCFDVFKSKVTDEIADAGVDKVTG